jgi:translocator assembly and maintenance protein 41
MASTTPLSAVLEVVPEVEHAFGYGSGVFAQPQASASDDAHADAVRRASGDAASASTRGTPTMVDYVFAVRSPLEWHAENMRRNPSHYAPHLRALGPAAVVAIADRVGVGVHFNTLVPWRGAADAGSTLGPGHATHYKYGVVRLDTLCDDLKEWRSLFLAGRMQKPVAALDPDDDDARDKNARAAVAAASTANLRAALAAALLTLPETFSAEALRVALVGLSYRGDVRTWLGAEDRHKVARIAAGSAAAMDALYAPVAAEARAASVGLTRVEGKGTRGSGGAWGQDKSQAATRFLCRWLPRSALGARGERTGPGPGPDDAQAAARAASRRDLGPALLHHVDATVRRSSLRQIAASALATSPGKAAAYAAAKFAKSAASRFRKPPR